PSHCLSHADPAPTTLPSFPTRRSSDLARRHEATAAGNHRAEHGERRGSEGAGDQERAGATSVQQGANREERGPAERGRHDEREQDRKSTRLNSSHLGISYAVFCLKKKK